METPEEFVRRFTIPPEEESIQQRIERVVTNGAGYLAPLDSENRSSLLDLIIHLGKLALREENKRRLLQKDYTPSKKMLELQELIDFRNKLGLRVTAYNDRASLYREFYRQRNVERNIPGDYLVKSLGE